MGLVFPIPDMLFAVRAWASVCVCALMTYYGEIEN